MGILSVQNLHMSYRQEVILKGLTLSVQQGEIYGLLGHNGAGKSTTIDCILGFKNYSQGEISLLGLSPKQFTKQLFENIGVQFQNSHYQKKLRVKELCQLTSSFYKNSADWRYLLQRFDLLKKENAFIETLSGGEAQKLAVLLTLIPKPKIIFLDELTTGLDPIARRNVWKQLLALKKEGLTIFLTSHYMDEVAILCDRIGIIIDGKIGITGTVNDVIQSSGHDTLENAFIHYT